MKNKSNSELISEAKELAKEKNNEALERIDDILKELTERNKKRFESIGR